MLSFKKKRTVKLTVKQMAKRNGMTPAEAEKMALGICEKGLLEFDRETKNGERQFFVPKWVVGSGEYMLMTGSLMEKARALVPILVPLFISAFRRADELATAMECRCYQGGEGRTKMKLLRYHLWDYQAFGVGVLLVAAVVALGSFGL